MGLNQAIQSQILFRGKQPNKKGISYTLGWFISAPALASIVLFSLLNWKLDLWESKVICGYYIFVFSGLVFEYLRLICICVFSSLVFIWPAFVYFYVKYLCGLDFEMAEQTKRRVATGADFGPWALSYLLHLFVLLLFSIFSLNNITGALRLFPTHFLSFHFYPARARSARAQRARALRALGLLLADGTPTVGGGKTFWRVSRIFLRKQL